MKFVSTPIAGAHIVELEKRGDARGFFARAFCEKEYAAAGLVPRYVQVNNSLTQTAGTLRGMHYQLPPSAEIKVVRCIRGALFDVIIDMRPDSPSCGKWYGIELSAENRLSLYVPRGCAHGFITLQANTEAFYMVSDFYDPSQERGLRYDDPHFGIEWPMMPVEISEKDRSWPLFDPQFHGTERLRGLL